MTGPRKRLGMEVRYLNVIENDLKPIEVTAARRPGCEAVYIGTRYFTAMDVGLGCPMPGREIGYSTFGKELKDTPYPPEMWFAKEMLDALMDWSQLMKEPEHRKYLGWSYGINESPDGYQVMNLEVLKFEMPDGRFWLWKLTGEKDERNNREKGVWRD